MSNIMKTIGNFKPVALIDAGKSKLVSAFITAQRAVNEKRSVTPLSQREKALEKAADDLQNKIAVFNTVMLMQPVQTKSSAWEGEDQVEEVMNSSFLLLTDEQMKVFKIKDNKIDLKDSKIEVKKFYTSKVNSMGNNHLSPVYYAIVASTGEEHFATIESLAKSLFSGIGQFKAK
jgi:hypothetical protein